MISLLNFKLYLNKYLNMYFFFILMIHLTYASSYYCMVLGDNHITHVRYIKMETTNYIKHL